MNRFSCSVALLRSRKFHTFKLNNRSLLNHLIRTYQMILRQGFNENLALIGLLHSVYGQLYGYNNMGLEYNERDLIQNIVGEEIEANIFLYHQVIENKGCFQPEEVDGEIILRDSCGFLNIKKDVYSDLINVSFLDIAEQVEFVLNLKKKNSYLDFLPYLQRYESTLKFFNKKNEQLWQHHWSNARKHAG